MTAAPAARTQAGPWRDVDGIVLLDKPEGLTSNAALQRVRRSFRARKAGHTGSLDPLASGLLPICLGQATKASGLLLDADKTYGVRVVFGARTTTGDREGEIAETAPVPTLSAEFLRGVTSSFIGESTQVPPMYSALKHQGERLYRLARKGVEVERPPRSITICRLDILEIGTDWVTLEVVCSKGTYVRSLAEDLARGCGTVGHVASLRRLALGPFTSAQMHTLDAIEQSAMTGCGPESMLLPADQALTAYPAVQLGIAEQAAVLQGRTVPAVGPGASRVRMYGVGGRFLGIGRMSAEGARVAPERIMVEVSNQPQQRA
jgi:tRNA pseudouridine55 synthase